MKYFQCGPNFEKKDYFPVEITEENESEIEDKIVFDLREHSFHMSDEECKEMVDEFLTIYPELLLFRRRSFYYNCC